MSKMFKSVQETWNVVTGCHHACKYCYAKILAEGRVKHLDRYKDGFHVVKLHEAEFKRKFRPDTLVFVVNMGDLFGRWVPAEGISRVIDYTTLFPETDFLFLTKNPWRYFQFTFPNNAILGTTIETNRHYTVTGADPPATRYRALRRHLHPRKFVSIEPVMAFDLAILHKMIADIKPELVEIGCDNYGFHLPEPSGAMVRELVKQLRQFTVVQEKDSLQRLV